jgi:CBS domain containing-hemolysin-like protein
LDVTATIAISSPQLSSILLQEGGVDTGLAMPWSVVLLLISVAGYALVNAIEIAIVGSSRIRMRHLAEEGRKSAQAVERLREREDRFFAAVVIFQNLFVVVASSMATFIAVDIAGGWGLLIGTVIITAAIALFGEVTPKVLAVKAAEPLSLAVARPVELVMSILRPITAVFAAAPNILSRVFFGADARVSPTVTEAELRMLIDIGAEEGSFGEEEAELMERVFRFYDRRVNEIMVPRTEIVWLEAGTTVREFYTIYDENPHTRFPVHSGSIDNVVGVVNIKDVLRGVAQGKVNGETVVGGLMRPASFVPESKLAGRLFVEMQEHRQQMAIVVDEYGGTAGAITIEILLEEIVGAVVDELGETEPEFQEIDERTLRIDGGMSVHEARDDLGLAIPEGDYETIAGYVLEELGHIPKEGEMVAGEGFRMSVANVTGRKIEEVVVTRVPTDESEPGGDAAAS